MAFRELMELDRLARKLDQQVEEELKHPPPEEQNVNRKMMGLLSGAVWSLSTLFMLIWLPATLFMIIFVTDKNWTAAAAETSGIFLLLIAFYSNKRPAKKNTTEFTTKTLCTGIRWGFGQSAEWAVSLRRIRGFDSQ